MRPAIGIVLLWLLLAVWPASLCGWVPPASADEVVHSGTPDTIRHLRESAASDRAFVLEQQKRADAWRELASQAQAEADRARSPSDRQMWLDDVGRRIARAEAIEADNVRLIAQAEEKEARAAHLDKAYQEKYDAAGNLRPAMPAAQPEPISEPPTQPQASPMSAAEPAAAEDEPCWRLSEAEAVGVWRDTKDQSPFAIRPKNPEAPPEGQAFDGLTMSRSWEGTYNAEDACGVPRLTFRYKPKAEEMNPQVPDWARKAVEGKLEWQIELREGGTCGSHRLKASWFPGEIGWREDGEGQQDGAWIAGKGSPRDFILAPDIVLEGDLQAAPSLVVGIQGQPDPFGNPIEAMIEQQRFDVRLSLPKDLAEEVGTETSVTVKNLTNGDSTTLVVAAPQAALARDYVIYQLTAPATIADVGEEGRRDYWIIPLNPGDRIDLTADNGDQIEVSWRDANHQFRIYETWVQLGIARHERRFAELSAIFESLLVSPDASRDIREQAHRRLRMIKNARTLIERPEILDHIKFAIGRFYLEASPPFIGIDDTGERHLPVMQRTSQRWLGPEQVPNKYGFLWTSHDEAEVLGVMATTRKEYRDQAMVDIGVAFTMGMYTGVVAASGVGEIYTIRTGEDIYGRKVTGFERFMTAVGLVSGGIVIKLGPTALKTFLRPVDGRVGAMVRTPTPPVAIRSGQLPPALGGKAPKAVLPAGTRAPDPITCPSGSSKPVIEYPKPRIEYPAPPAAAAEPGAPKPTIEYPPSRRRPTIEYPQAKPKIEYPDTRPAHIELEPELDTYVKFGYGPFSPVVEITPEMQALRQKFGTCNCMATMYAKFKQTGQITQQGEAMQMLNRKGILPVDRYVRAGSSVHVTNTEIEQLVPAFNGQSIDLKGGSLSLETIHAWQKRGWIAKDVIRFPGDKVNHAVIIDEFMFKANGEISAVRVFDSNVGGIIEVPVCEYTKLRNPPGTQGVQLLKFGPRPNITVPARQ